MEEIEFVSFDGEKIYCYEWKCDYPKGIVQIVHGLEEHALRYDSLAQFLNKHGYIVFASDQRLHGKTANGHLGITSIKDVFPVMVKDQMMISDMLIEKYNKPLVVMGHSYGSFETQSFLQKYNRHSGIILCGSAYMKRLDVLAGKILTYAIKTIKGGQAQSKMIENLVIGQFNHEVKQGSWISANDANVKRYEKDELCGVPLCANFYYSMFKNTRTLYDKENIEKAKDVPILIASGKDDPVGKMGKSVQKLYNFYKKHGLNASIKLYDNMRHEIFNEKNKLAVQNDFLKFIGYCCNQG